MTQKDAESQVALNFSRGNLKKSKRTRRVTCCFAYLIIALADSPPLWKVALLRSFQIAYRIFLIRKIAMLFSFRLTKRQRKKKTERTFAEKVGRDSKSEITGEKCVHTDLARLQFRKQWSIVSLRLQTAHRSEGMYPQFRIESRILTPRRVINQTRSLR